METKQKSYEIWVDFGYENKDDAWNGKDTYEFHSEYSDKEFAKKIEHDLYLRGVRSTKIKEVLK